MKHWLRPVLVTTLSVFLVSVVVGAGRGGSKTRFPLARPATTPASGNPVWKDVDAQIADQKFQAALDGTLQILKEARARGQDRLVSESLIKATQLQLGLHGYETAVRFIKVEAWPKAGLDRALLDLYYAYSLMAYRQVYGWEIGQREKTSVAAKASEAEVDLKAWTTEQIGREISRAFDRAMVEVPDLGAPVPEFFRSYMSANNYPAGVRPDLRDAIVYMTVRHLQNTSYWPARQSAETYKLDFAKLASGALRTRVAAADEVAHPLEKIASWLGEHADFHGRAGRPDASLEARYEAFRVLHGAVSEGRDRALVREELRKLQASADRSAWWSAGQALLAEFIRAEDRDDRQIEARAVAQAGRNANSKGPGGQMCAQIIHDIDAPSYELSAMTADAAHQRSLLVSYRNISKIYFRTYAVDWATQLKDKRGVDFSQVDYARTNALISGQSGPPVATWNVELPATPDFSDHRAFVVPPELRPGFYTIVGSLRSEFAGAENKIMAVPTTVTDLVLRKEMIDERELQVRAVSGRSGLPLPGVRVQLESFEWNKPSEVAASAETDRAGYVRFHKPKTSSRGYASYFVLATKGDQFAVETENIYFGDPGSDRSLNQALVYTDRSIYRPQQSLSFKVVVTRANPLQVSSRPHPLARRSRCSSTIQITRSSPNGR